MTWDGEPTLIRSTLTIRIEKESNRHTHTPPPHARAPYGDGFTSAQRTPLEGAPSRVPHEHRKKGGTPIDSC